MNQTEALQVKKAYDDIVCLLNQIKDKKKTPLILHGEEFLKFFSRGTAFITFSYGK